MTVLAAVTRCWQKDSPDGHRIWHQMGICIGALWHPIRKTEVQRLDAHVEVMTIKMTNMSHVVMQG